jgi:uncharacterized protein (TIGR02145 family)
MRTIGYTLVSILLLTNFTLFSQGILKVSSGGKLTINGNLNILSPSFTCGDPFTDARDGKIYSTVKIGTQCWMKQNLNYGTMINLEQTNNNIPEKYCYNNLESNCDVYGGLYEWWEVMQYSTTPGVQGMCPSGWHVPTNGEWNTLNAFLGMDAGGQLKEAGYVHWLAPNLGATNSSGFTGLPGGMRYTSDIWLYLGEFGFFYTSTDDGNPVTRALGHLNSDLGLQGAYGSMGYSVRCVKN